MRGPKLGTICGRDKKTLKNNNCYLSRAFSVAGLILTPRYILLCKPDNKPVKHVWIFSLVYRCHIEATKVKNLLDLRLEARQSGSRAYFSYSGMQRTQ